MKRKNRNDVNNEILIFRSNEKRKRKKNYISNFKRDVELITSLLKVCSFIVAISLEVLKRNFQTVTVYC